MYIGQTSGLKQLKTLTQNIYEISCALYKTNYWSN